MELKEGMYVKYTRGALNGYIAPRIAKLKENINNSDIWKLDVGCDVLENDILKASYNIIDLIEVGDIIEFDVTDYDNYSDVFGFNHYKIENEETLINIKDMFENESAVLLSIVTKEQMKSIQYKVN